MKTRARPVRTVSISLLIASMLTVTLGAATAAEGDTFKSSFGEGAVTLAAERGQAAAAASRNQSTVANYVPPEYTFAKIPACSGNDVNAGLDAPCPEAAEACPDPDAYQWWLYRGALGLSIGEPGWTRVGTFCSTPAAPGTDPALPGFTLADFQRLPLPAGASTVQPPGDYVLIREPTIVYATDTEPTLIDTTLAGLDVQVRATPAHWSWDFGDGTVVGPTSDPGAPWPALRNHHAYTARGTHDITMTTHYTGEYAVSGGPWLPIPGEATVTSAPRSVQVLAGEAKLVDAPLP